MSNHRWGLRIAGLPALALLLGACRAEPPVAVGVALSATFVDAARMALEDAVAAGGLPPLDTLFLAESSNRAGPALAMADSFVNRSGMVAVLAHSNSTASLAAAPIYNSARIVQIAPTSTSVRFSESGDFSFRLAPADPLQGELLAHAVDSLFPPGTRIALLFINDDYGQGLRTAVLRHLDRTRFPVVFDQPHADVETSGIDTSQAVLVDRAVGALGARRPDLILWLGRAATLRTYLPAIRRDLGPLPILGGDALSAYSPEDLVSGLWDGLRFADYLDLQGTEELQAFARRFGTRQPTGARTAEVLSYDAMRLMLAAIRDGARSGDEVRRWLLSLGRERPAWPGLSGPISFTEQGDVNRGYHLLTIPTRAAP